MVRPVSDRGGFTLIEVLVALMISSLLVGVIFQLMDGQGRYAQIQSAREEAQQNSRAAIELIGSELRSLPPGGDGIEQAFADSVTLRAVRVWGVVCVGSAGGNSVTVRIPRLRDASFSLNLGTSFVANTADTPGAEDWTSEVRVSGIGSPITSPPASCLVGETGSPGPQVEVRTLTLSTVPRSASSNQEPVAGDVAYLYDEVTYRMGESSEVPGRWVQRRLGPSTGTNQPMAGPVPEDGLRLTYYQAGSETPLPTPVTDPALRRAIDRVMLVVKTRSRNPVGDVRATKVDTVVVARRNRS